MSTYYSKYDKTHDGNGIAFDAVVPAYAFAPLAIAASQTAGTVQQVLAVPQDTKFQKISVSCAAISGAATVQIVVGGAAVGAEGTANAACVSGTPLNVTPIAVPAANTQTTVVCDAPDAVVAAGSNLPLTLRAVTASGNTVTGLQVTLAGVPVDPYPDGVPGASADYNNANPNNW